MRYFKIQPPSQPLFPFEKKLACFPWSLPGFDRGHMYEKKTATELQGNSRNGATDGSWHAFDLNRDMRDSGSNEHGQQGHEPSPHPPAFHPDCINWIMYLW